MGSKNQGFKVFKTKKNSKSKFYFFKEKKTLKIPISDSAGASLNEAPNYSNWPSIFWRHF